MQIQNYFRSYVNSVIARDKAKFEKSPAVKKAAKKEAQDALTDDVVAQIKEHAKKRRPGKCLYAEGLHPDD